LLLRGNLRQAYFKPEVSKRLVPTIPKHHAIVTHDKQPLLCRHFWLRQPYQVALFIEGLSPGNLDIEPNGCIGAILNERKRAFDRGRSVIKYRNVRRRRLWLGAWGFDERFEILQGMASHEVIINSHLAAIVRGQIHSADSSAFPS